MCAFFKDVGFFLFHVCRVYLTAHYMYVHDLFALFPEEGVGFYGTGIVCNYELACGGAGRQNGYLIFSSIIKTRESETEIKT